MVQRTRYRVGSKRQGKSAQNSLDIHTRIHIVFLKLCGDEMVSLLVLNGPNLNMLGTRQPEVYGQTTLADLEKLCIEAASTHGASLDFRQTNQEGELVDWIHAARGKSDGIILNAGAYTHTSIAIMDAIVSAGVPTLELHLSNIHAREDFRHKSFIAPVAIGQICGLGARGYPLAVQAMLSHLSGDPE